MSDIYLTILKEHVAEDMEELKVFAETMEFYRDYAQSKEPEVQKIIQKIDEILSKER